MYIKNIIKKSAPCIFDNYNKSGPKFDVVLYGAAEKGRQLLKRCLELGFKVVCFCDDDEKKWGMTLDGIKVVAPAELKDKYLNLPIFISSKWSDGISEKLRKEGHKNIYHRFAIDYLINIDNLQKAYDLLDDSVSKKVYEGLVEYVFTQQPDIFKKITVSEEQYFLGDIFKFSPDEYLVDGGAFVGDTVERYNKISGGNFKKIYCFEPDSENFIKLAENIKMVENYASRIEIYNIGLHRREGMLYFSNSHNSASCIVEFSDHCINVSSIDEIIMKRPVTMIKMDLEGAESEALKGAEEIIRFNKPKLAICNYHLPADLWEIPLIIKELVPGYKLYLRHHNVKCWYESVIYAKI